ncbi:MAG: hypothetical protein HOC79_09530 [Euryarchaeota archaeon]|nr:hypothetical protein [Euryarchaeota archaeon]
MERFEGDLSHLWKLGEMKPLHRLTWDWWWWLVMLRHPTDPTISRQLMVLWSTKDTPVIDVSGLEWNGGRPLIDEEGGYSVPGMVAAWWFDGEKMWEPIVRTPVQMAAIHSRHSLWPQKASAEPIDGSGAVIPICERDLSMGLRDDGSSFWLHLEADEKMIERGSSKKFDLEMTPWTKPMSTARWAHKEYAAGMGYDILRLHGAKVNGIIDGEKVEGTAYFQKVCVEAPSPPWYWGMLHANDGSYFDWFMPHLAPTITAKDDRPWKLRDTPHIAISPAGLFHDAQRERSEKFEKVQVQKIPGERCEGGDGNYPDAPLPVFEVKMWNGRTTIHLRAEAVSRAHWTFDQPTRGRMTSHLTYNEYPLKVTKMRIKDEIGVRTLKDYEWITGNGEHAWGILH